MSRSATALGAVRQPLVTTILQTLIVFDTIALLFAGIVHLVGIRIPLGAAVFVEPPIIPAGIVETLAGLIFVIAAYAVLIRRMSGWGWALGAHLFAIAGFLLGIWATRNGTTPFNHAYHYVMLTVFVVGLALLLVSDIRARLGRGKHGQREG